MKKALRTYTRDFIAILVLGVIGLLALFVILSQQSTALPSWFPFLGEDRFELKTEFQTAQAVTPGQGQTVNLSGVEIGDVTKVELENGVAVVTMQVDPEFAQLIHPDASALLRPRTGLQDMTIELDAGTDSGEIPEGFTIPLANSAPNINPDQILASLDGDTRAYLRLLLAGGAQAFGTRQKSQDFAQVLRRLDPTVRDIAKINGAIAKRRNNLRRVVTNFKLIAEELAKSDTNLTGFVDSQNSVFGAFAESEAKLRETLRALPGALRETRGALNASATLSGQLEARPDRPAAAGEGARSGAEGDPAVLPQDRAVDPDPAPSVHAEGRHGRRRRPPRREAARGVLEPAPGSFTELNQLVNALAYNPSGSGESYLFYLSWLNHNTNAGFLTQDGLGPIRRGAVHLHLLRPRSSPTTLGRDPPVDWRRPATSSGCRRPPRSARTSSRSRARRAEAPSGDDGEHLDDDHGRVDDDRRDRRARPRRPPRRRRTDDHDARRQRRHPTTAEASTRHRTTTTESAP